MADTLVSLSLALADGATTIEWLHSSHSAFVIPNFLSQVECEDVLAGASHFQRSLDSSGVVRISETSVIPAQSKSGLHASIDRRLLAHVTRLSNESAVNPYLSRAHPLGARHLEPAHITRYPLNGRYDWHVDGRPSSRCVGLATTNCRAFTVIVYLDVNSPAESGGGESGGGESGGGATEIKFEDASVVRVHPTRGAALFFHSHLSHRGEALLSGHKVILNQWIRFRPMPWVLYEGMCVSVRVRVSVRGRVRVRFGLGLTPCRESFTRACALSSHVALSFRMHQTRLYPCSHHVRMCCLRYSPYGFHVPADPTLPYLTLPYLTLPYLTLP